MPRRHRVVAVPNRPTSTRRSGLPDGCRVAARVRRVSLPAGKVPASRLANRDRVVVTRQRPEASARSVAEVSRRRTVLVAGVAAVRPTRSHGAANRVPRVAVAARTGVRRAAKAVVKGVRVVRGVKAGKAVVARQGVSLDVGRPRAAAESSRPTR